MYSFLKHSRRAEIKWLSTSWAIFVGKFCNRIEHYIFPEKWVNWSLSIVLFFWVLKIVSCPFLGCWKGHWHFPISVLNSQYKRPLFLRVGALKGLMQNLYTPLFLLFFLLWILLAKFTIITTNNSVLSAMSFLFSCVYCCHPLSRKLSFTIPWLFVCLHVCKLDGGIHLVCVLLSKMCFM